jgi:type I restriction enzyme M protein
VKSARSWARSTSRLDCPDLWRASSDERDQPRSSDNEDFGYRRDHRRAPAPPQLPGLTAERIERLEAETAFANLGKSKKKGDAAKLEIAEGRLLQESVRGVLAGLVAAGGKAGTKPVHDGKAFAKTLSAAFKKAGVSVPVGVMKAVMAALSERDESAPAVLDAKGKPEPDADLRDTESVPLTERIEDYFEREVKPHVPDAWIDESKTKVGYEIPFTRHFYKYQPLRPLSVIEAEIRALEAEIQGMLGEVIG